MINKLLSHPLTRGKDLDSPETTLLRKQIIEEKPFLRKVYKEWYQLILKEIPQNMQGGVLELGSGAGFFKSVIPEAITSDVFHVNGLTLVLDAHRLPFRAGSLKAIVMTNVLHHLPDPAKVFGEAARCIQPGGKMAMIEPWITSWSRVVYKRLHHEPIDENAAEWTISGVGPLSGANEALPWIIFQRDRDVFLRKFPMWKITEIFAIMPFRYILAGGISMRSLMFSGAYGFWRGFENLLKPWMPRLAMFAKIVMVRQ